MLIFASALLFASSQQSTNLNTDSRLDKRVTFRTVAAPAELAVAGLSKAAGISLKAGALMKREILLLRLQDAPLREAMVRLARASAGSWVLENGTYYLTRTPADDRRTIAANYDAFVLAMKKELAKLAKAATEQTSFTAQNASDLAKKFKTMVRPQSGEGEGSPQTNFINRTKMEAATPAGRLADRILSKLDAETIASAPSGKRTILSTSPTKMEGQLNLDLSNALGSFVAEANLWADAISDFSDDESMQLFYPYGGPQTHVSGTPARVNLILDRDFNGILGVNLSVRVYDSSGAVIGRSQRTIRTDEGATKAFAALIPDPKEVRLAIPPGEMAILGVMSRAMGGGTSHTPPIPSDIRQQLMNPDKFEPLASSASTLTLEAADVKNLNVVADLPDLFQILGIISTRNGMPTATSFLSMLQMLPPGTCPAQVDKGWLEIDGGTGPGDNLFMRRDDRPELSRLFNSGDGTSLSTEALARYAFGGGGGRSDFMWLQLTTVLCPASEFEDDTRWRMLTLLGALMHRQGDSTLVDGRIPFSTMDRDSLEEVHDIVFRHDPRMLTLDSRGIRSEVEPCEVLPNGLPSDGYVSVSTTSEEVVYTVAENPQAMTSLDLAFNTAQKNHPGRFGNFEPVASTSDKFRAGTKRIVRLTIHLTDKLAHQMMFEEKQPPHRDPVSFEQLPEKFKAAVKSALSGYEQQDKKGN